MEAVQEAIQIKSVLVSEFYQTLWVTISLMQLRFGLSIVMVEVIKDIVKLQLIIKELIFISRVISLLKINWMIFRLDKECFQEPLKFMLQANLREV